MAYKIAILPGDGIGPEIINQAEKLLQCLQQDFGFKVVIAPSFADIFYNNSFKNGLLPIALSPTLVDQLFAELEQQQDYRLDIDLENQLVTNAAGFEMPFEIEESRKYCLLNGFDDIGLTMQHADHIKAFEAQYYKKFPWL